MPDDAPVIEVPKPSGKRSLGNAALDLHLAFSNSKNKDPWRDVAEWARVHGAEILPEEA